MDGGVAPAGVSPVSKMELRERLLALNTPERPFAVREGEDTDLVAEWKIVDASWWGVFAKAGLKKTYRLLLALDEEKNEVRALEEESSIDWQGGRARGELLPPTVPGHLPLPLRAGRGLRP